MNKAIILAAGIGWRMGGGYPPKSLFEFGGRSLLMRHVDMLGACGVGEIVVGVGYRHHLVNAELEHCRGARVSTVYNPDFREGNIVTLWHLREHLDCGEDVMLMDADVLYDMRLLRRLVASAHASCLLLDRHCDPGEEPVKACVRGRRIVEFGKTIDPTVDCDFHGESVGFFKLSASCAARLREVVDGFIARGERDTMYEEALRALLQADADPTFGFEDVTGLPWIEIDFHSDLERARRDVLPRLHHLPEQADDAA